ncbi:MAG TPA: DUF5658 family protein [Bryobacteraceae bacterium]|nr:DUF5658 family protein [Bryobacteraceae bacterium]
MTISREFPSSTLALFLGLQILDVATTMIGLHFGAREGSGFIGRLLQAGPLTGLLISKILAAGLAAIAVFMHKKRVLVFLNFWFAAVVGWNLVAIALQYLTQ